METTPMVRNPGWRQNCPIDQFVALRFGLEGCLSNAMDGIKPESSLHKAMDLAEQLRDLEPFLRADPHHWPEEG
jgi:hypothetical protein